MRRVVVAACCGLLAGWGSTASGQDSQFGIRGLGTPGNFSSVRAWTTGGALAPFDGNSPLTDAALGDITRLTAAATEFASYRSVDDGTSASTLRSARFPMLTVAGPVFGGLVIGGGFATYLFRSYDVEVPGTVVIRGDSQAIVDHIASNGAVTDLRLAAAWRFSSRLTVGAGFHVLTGSSTLNAIRLFSDSAEYHNATQTDQESYDGIGMSLSVLATPVPSLRISGFLRSDTRLRAEIAGFQNAQNDLPTTVGGGVMWSVTPEVKLAGTLSHADWAVAGGGAYNTTDWALGGEFGRAGLPFRLGVRGGQLPFGPGPTAPTEFGVSAGTGFIFSQGRGIVDLGIERLRRSGGGLNETDWTFLVGISVRP